MILTVTIIEMVYNHAVYCFIFFTLIKNNIVKNNDKRVLICENIV